MKSALKSLVEIISQNVDVLDAALEKRGAAPPSLDEPFKPGSDVANGQPELMATADIACRAALQLVQLIRLPQLSVLQDAVSHLVSVSMRCAVELHVAEILKEAGPEGLHVSVIAKKCNVDPVKLVSVLRCLAGRWIFREVSPDVFANNRFSSLLDKGKHVQELRQSPETMFEKPQAALSATIGHFTDEGLKSSAYFYEVMTDPKLSMSGEPNDAGFNKAFDTKEPFWDFVDQPAQKHRQHRFNMAMDGVERMSPPNHPLVGFDWASLPDGATVVDVGGGVGTLVAKVAGAHPKLRFVVQDRPGVVEEGEKRCEDLVRDGRLSFQAHDFFEPNPIKNPDVFVMKRITHDWSDAYVTKILRQLRTAAGKNTRLLSIDRIIPYTCPIPEGEVSMQVPGIIKSNFPPPITIAFSDNASFKSSVLMMTLLNGQERTIKHIVDLFAGSGWKVEKVVQFEGQGAIPSYICAVPI